MTGDPTGHQTNHGPTHAPRDETATPDPLLEALRALRPSQTDLCGRSLRDAVRRRLVGDLDRPFRFGRFTVLGRLGSGGMGTVFVAYDPDLDRRVAVKVLHNRGERGHSAALREGRALARLRHPNVVTVHEAGIVDGQVFVVMEYIAGEHLGAWARGRPQAELLARLLEAGHGLAAAHAVGLVHHDFKPENVVIDASGQARVIDFGLARDTAATTNPAVSGDDDRDNDRDDDRSPPASTLGGTPAYMAPERQAGLAGDPRSDQYSFCVTAWEVLTGARPAGVPTPPRELPGPIASALRRGLALAPEDRFPAMPALLAALSPHPRRRRSRSAALALVLSLALALLTTLALLYRANLPRTPEGPRCTSPWELLAGTWDETRAATIAAAFAESEVPFARETWATLRPRLDRYATAWIATHTRACEERAVLGVLPPELYERRVLCLEEARLHLAAVASRLETADPEAITRAHGAIDRLLEPEACAEPEVTRWAQASDPAILRERLALREERAQARAELDTGDFAGGLARLELLLGRAQAVGDRQLLGELHQLAGYAEETGSRFEASGEHFRTALSLAIAEDQPVTAALAAIGLAAARRELHTGDPLNLELLDLAEAFSRRGGDPLRVRLNLLHARATALKHADRPSDALAAFDEHRALALAHDQAAAAANALINRGICRDDLGDYTGAAADYRQSIAELSALLGPLHPRLATAHTNLGAALMALGDLDGAIEHTEASAAIIRANFGEVHLIHAVSKIHLGALLKERGRLDDALAHSRDGLRLLRQILGPEHPNVGLAHCAVASDLQALGRPEEGLAEAARGAAIYAAASPETDCDRLMCTTIRGDLLHDLGRHAEAAALLEATLPAIAAGTCPPEQRGESELFLARELWELGGRRERARILELLEATGDRLSEASAAERERLRAALRRAPAM